VRDIHRFRTFVLAVGVIAACASVGFAQDSDADKAKALLEQGIREFNALEYGDAQKTLLKVKPEHLSDADKKTLDYYRDRINEDIKKQMAARATYKAAKKALKAGELEKAKAGFAATIASEYMHRQDRDDARALLGVVNKKIEIARSAALEKQKVSKPQPDTAAGAPEEGRGDKTAAAATQPAGTVKGSDEKDKAEQKAKKEQRAKARRMLEDMAARRRKAQELIALGRKALDDRQPERAVFYFQRALALAPEDPVAKRQLNYARQMTATVGESGILSRLERNQRIARQAADLEFDKAMKRAYELLARADSTADFDAAAAAAQVAKNVVETNKGLYSERDYRERLVKVQEQLRHIGNKRDEWERKRVLKQAAEIEKQQRERIRKQQQRRERTIATLTDRAKTLRSQGNYEQAQEIVEQILTLDPANAWAAEQVEILKEYVLLRHERQAIHDQRYQEQKELVELRRSEIPWWDLLKYPRDWKELTLRREPFGAERGGESETDRAVRQILREPLRAKLDFDGIEFGDVIGFMREISGVNIVVKWKALEMAGIDKSTPVTVKLSGVTFEKALRVILDDVGGVTPLSHVLDEGVITISTKEDLSTLTVTRVYDIRDLIVRVPNFTAPRIDLEEVGQNAGNNAGGGGGGGGLFGNDNEGDNENEENIPTRGEIIANIISLVQETIAPDSWRPTGDIGSIRELQGQLVVTQTAENHQALQDLISELREARALQINIEARFISVNTGFLNSIGIDLDFFFNLGSRLGANTVVDPFTGATVPTTAAPSGWGDRFPGDNKWTPLAVAQNSSTFTRMLGVSTAVGDDIGGTVTSSALSVAGTFLDDIQVDFLIEATQADSRTRSLAAPRLTLFNGQRAYVVVATYQAYVADLEPVISENAVAFDPQPAYAPTGTILDVEATISADRRYVTLTLRPQVSTLNSFSRYATTVAGTDAEGNPLIGEGFIQLPNISIQQLETTVSVPDGGTLLIGGQRLSMEIEREMGVPLLNKIPIINRAFTNRGKVRDEQTLLILVKPKIIIHREEEERQFPPD